MSDKDIKNPKIVMIGDSLTDWCDWNFMLRRNDILNRGVAGDSTVDLLARIHTIVNCGAQYGFIMIGTNDLTEGRLVSDILKNYVRILEDLAAHNIAMTVQLVLYTKNLSKNIKISELNEKLKNYCNEKGIRIIDLNLVLAKDGVLDQQYSDDGLHLNEAGYNAWASVLNHPL